MIAIVEFETKQQNSAILEKQNRREELCANSIEVDWGQNHIVFSLKHYDNSEYPRLIGREVIAYRASDVVYVHICDEED